MSYWRSEYDDGWWTFYKDGIEIKLDNPNFGDLIVDEINNANQRIAELEAYIDELENPQSIQDACICEDNPQDDRAGLYIDPDCPVHGEAQMQPRLELTAHDATERQDDKWIPEVQE